MDTLRATMLQAVGSMQLQSRRIEVAAENISNADTPGYRRKILVPDASGFSPQAIGTRVALDQTPGVRIHDPSHPMADGDGYVIGSNVSMITEMGDMREANHAYEASLNSFQQARSMYRSLLDILRK